MTRSLNAGRSPKDPGTCGILHVESLHGSFQDVVTIIQSRSCRGKVLDLIC
jgi:hypothetical protein